MHRIETCDHVKPREARMRQKNSLATRTSKTIKERKVGFTENTAARHRRGGGREVTVTSKLHTQEYRSNRKESNDRVREKEGFTKTTARGHAFEFTHEKFI